MSGSAGSAMVFLIHLLDLEGGDDGGGLEGCEDDFSAGVSTGFSTGFSAGFSESTSCDESLCSFVTRTISSSEVTLTSVSPI